MKNLLVKSKYLLYIPVFASLLMMLAVVVLGTGRIIYATINLFTMWDFSPKAAKVLSTVVIETIDLFLVGTVAYIFALGLYKLFISSEEIQLPIRLRINTLKDLEDKIVGVIIAALAVAFLGTAASEKDLTSILYYGGGIALVIAALAVFMKMTDKKVNKEADKDG